MTEQEQTAKRLDSRPDEADEPDVEAHRLGGVDRAEKVHRIDERDVEAHRFDKLEDPRAPD